jgi:hypothetical protein
MVGQIIVPVSGLPVAVLIYFPTEEIVNLDNNIWEEVNYGLELLRSSEGV